MVKKGDRQLSARRVTVGCNQKEGKTVRAAVEFQSPLGPLSLFEEAGALVSLDFGPLDRAAHKTDLLVEASVQLQQYFAGQRKVFTLPLRPQGTPFQKQVWQQLLLIPYGQTLSYGRQAAALGRPTAARAVGGANGKNPLPILIPCHRVIAADGSLGGYSSGLKTKEFLLSLEGCSWGPGF